MGHESRLRQILATATNERQIHAFLKRDKYLVRNAYNAWAWNYTDVLPEFRLGGEYRTDFLVLSANSGQWYASLVELKSHLQAPFTKEGTPVKDLNIALGQLQDRELWLRLHETEFRRSLERYFRSRDVPAQCSNAIDHIHASTEILDARTQMSMSHFIVMGRREMIPKGYQRRRFIQGTAPIEISTYDRLLDVAAKLDEGEKEMEAVRGDCDT